MHGQKNIKLDLTFFVFNINTYQLTHNFKFLIIVVSRKKCYFILFVFYVNLHMPTIVDV